MISTAGRVIRWSTVLAVLGVAAVAAVAACERASDLVRAHGEAGWTARLVPVAVDGLICASSMVMVDSARREAPVPRLRGGCSAWASRRRSRPTSCTVMAWSARVGAWPAVAPAGSYQSRAQRLRDDLTTGAARQAQGPQHE
jgi:Protein of unknown function (DUF2637)